MREALEAIAEANSLPAVYAANFPHLHTAASVVNQCHPLMMQTLLTTGDGDCMYHALSRVVCGSEQLSKIFRLFPLSLLLDRLMFTCFFPIALMSTVCRH